MSRGRGIWLLALLLAVSPVLGASEEAAGHGQGSMDLIGKVINFLVLFGGLTFVLIKPLRALLRSRTENARRALEESEAERKTGVERLFRARERLAGLAAEAAAMRQAAEDEGRAEQERIRRLAREEMDKVKNLTQLEMDAQARSGVRELKRYTAELAARKAMGRLRKSLTPERQAWLIERSIEALARKDEKTGPDPKVRPGAR